MGVRFYPRSLQESIDDRLPDRSFCLNLNWTTPQSIRPCPPGCLGTRIAIVRVKRYLADLVIVNSNSSLSFRLCAADGKRQAVAEPGQRARSHSCGGRPGSNCNRYEEAEAVRDLLLRQKTMEVLSYEVIQARGNSVRSPLDRRASRRSSASAARRFRLRWNDRLLRQRGQHVASKRTSARNFRSPNGRGRERNQPERRRRGNRAQTRSMAILD